MRYVWLKLECLSESLLVCLSHGSNVILFCLTIQISKYSSSHKILTMDGFGSIFIKILPGFQVIIFTLLNQIEK